MEIYRDGEYFRLQEFACPLTGEIRVAKELLAMLDKVRGLYGSAITVTSGYRSRAHNVAVGGGVRSQHLLGTAADIQGGLSGDAWQALFGRLASQNPGGLGIYWSERPAARFFHVDVRRGRRARWGYDGDRKIKTWTEALELVGISHDY